MGASMCSCQVAPVTREPAPRNNNPSVQPKASTDCWHHGHPPSDEPADDAVCAFDADPVFSAQDQPALNRIILTAAKQGHTAILSVIIEHACKGQAAPDAEPALVNSHEEPVSQPLLLSAPGSGSNYRHLRRVIDAHTPLKQTPLMVASFYAKVDVVRLLLSVGADPWVTSHPFNRTALHYAALSGSSECLEALLQSMAPESAARYINLRTASGFTALGYAVASRSLAAVKVLLAGRPDVGLANVVKGADAPDFCAVLSTPLHLAAMVGSRSIVSEILRYYVESSAGCDSAGDTPVADVRLRQDMSRRRPCDVARLMGHEDLAALLHPSFSLDSMFPSDEAHYVGAPSLAVLAGAALKAGLLNACAAIDHEAAAEAAVAVCAVADCGDSCSPSMCCVEQEDLDAEGLYAMSNGMLAARPTMIGSRTGNSSNGGAGVESTNSTGGQFPNCPPRIAADGSNSMGGRVRDGWVGGTVGCSTGPLARQSPSQRRSASSASAVESQANGGSADQHAPRPLRRFASNAGGVSSEVGVAPDRRTPPNIRRAASNASWVVRQMTSALTELARSGGGGNSSAGRICSAWEAHLSGFAHDGGDGGRISAGGSSGELSTGRALQRQVSSMGSNASHDVGRHVHHRRGGSGDVSGDVSTAWASRHMPSSGGSSGDVSAARRSRHMHVSSSRSSRRLRTAGSSGSGCTSAKPVALWDAGSSSGGGSLWEGTDVCGVCYDRREAVCATSCKHRLCTACALQLAGQIQSRPAVCPFCRTPFSGFCSIACASDV